MKKRSNSFFGIHFDFHAMPGQVVGEDFRPGVVAELLDRVKPDYVQCDTKGHPGYSSYPTKVGNPASVIKEDVLKMWRDLTRERGIALYAHHSGLFDSFVVETHPEWAVKDEDGNLSEYYVSVFSPYVDEILIPQIKELMTDYEVDGAWIDGDCWAAVVDYSDCAMNTYRKLYKKEPPRHGDADYEEYREFCRDGFEKFVERYVSEVKKVNPDFDITSNWMYSGYMPGRMKVNLDFLSGDYSPTNSVEAARHDARCLSARNITWDLLAWGQNAIPFSYLTHNRSTKEYEQYCQEAAVVIALGGGFQFFNIMYGGGGTVQPWAIPVWERVAEFCREREFCHKAKAVPQVGLIYPMEKTDISGSALYSRELKGYEDLCSWNNAFLDSGFSTGFVYESEAENINEYPLLVLPQAIDFSKESIRLLENYVEKGGRLIVDLKSAKYFEKFAGVTVKETEENKLIFVEGKGALAAAETNVGKFDGEYNTVAEIYETNYFTDKKLPGAINKKIGKGYITFMCIDFADSYRVNVTTAIKEFLKGIVAACGYEPLVEISGSTFAELCVTQKDGDLLINIVNTAGQGGLSHVRGYNEVPKIGPIKVRVRTEKKKEIIRMPENKVLAVAYKDGYAEFTLDMVHIHTVAVVKGFYNVL